MREALSPTLLTQEGNEGDMRAFAALARSLLMECAEPFGEMLVPDHPGELARRALRHIRFALDRLYLVVPFPRDTSQLELAIDNLTQLTGCRHDPIRADPRCVALISAMVSVVMSHVGLRGVRASAAVLLLTAYQEILDAVNVADERCDSHLDKAVQEIAQAIRLLSGG
jgi:hypothetical protein